MKAALATVVVDNYNYAAYVADAIDSALAQTYSHLEVVVVDDGSTDQSVAIAERYGNAITLIAKPNEGQATSFNAGFAHSRGDVIYLLDGDDLLEPDAIAATIDRFAGGDVAKVHWRLFAIGPDGQRTGQLVPPYSLPHGDMRERSLRRGPRATPGRPQAETRSAAPSSSR